MTTPSSTPAPAPTPVDFPGKTLGIVGLVLAIVAPLVGLIVSIVANGQSKAAGFPNQLAKIGIIIGAILTGLGLLFTIFWIIVSISLATAASTYPY